MKPATATQLGKIIKNLTGHGNHDVYERKHSLDKQFQAALQVVYFYYIKFGNDGLPDTRVYCHRSAAPIQPGDMPDKIRFLAENLGNDNVVSLLAPSFQDVTWRNKSYVVIYMDSPHWKIFKYNDEADCNVEKGGLVFNQMKSGVPNHSFYDACHLEVKPKGVAEARSVIYFINHMKKSEFGDDLGFRNGVAEPQEERYSFDLFYEVGRKGGPSTIFIIDPDGTNLGPPEGPPPPPPPPPPPDKR